jgi:hypothetical protein
MESTTQKKASGFVIVVFGIDAASIASAASSPANSKTQSKVETSILLTDNLASGQVLWMASHNLPDGTAVQNIHW